VLGQIPDLTGASAEGEFALAKALDVVHPSRIDWPSTAAGLVALAILVVLGRTKLVNVSAVIALVIPTVGLHLAGNASVVLVEDLGQIPRGIPMPHLPDLSVFSVSVVTAALSIAVIVLVQGAGVAESAPNPDGTRADTNGDFAAQGRGEPGIGPVPRPPRRRISRQHGAQRHRGGPHKVGSHLLRPVDAADTGRAVGTGRHGGDADLGGGADLRGSRVGADARNRHRHADRSGFKNRADGNLRGHALPAHPSWPSGSASPCRCSCNCAPTPWT
jgi:hypothetical protein